MRNVQVIINSISFPKTLEELLWYIDEHGRFHLEDILSGDEDGTTWWTVPGWAMPGDVVLFFHAKTAIATIRHLLRVLEEDTAFPERHDEMREWLRRAEDLYHAYGGCVFASGVVTGRP